jgi:hypothetical protein
MYTQLITIKDNVHKQDRTATVYCILSLSIWIMFSI